MRDVLPAVVEDVLVDLVGDRDDVPLAGRARRSSPAPRGVKTLPVGLFGVLMMIALRVVVERGGQLVGIEASPAARSVTNRGVAPERIASGP